MSRGKELVKNSLILTIGRVSTQFISFLLLPLYTAVLSKKEYGSVDLVTTLVQLIIPIASLMIDQGVFRFLLSAKSKDEKRRVISNGFFTEIVMSVSVIILCTLISLFFTQEYGVWVLLILIITAYNNFFLQVARGLQRSFDYALGSFVCSGVTIALNVVCIVGLRMGAVGMLVATVLGNIVCALLLFFKLHIYEYVSMKVLEKKTLLGELKYSIPLVPNQLSLWIMNSSDRLIVAFILGTAANGVLAVSHKFPIIYTTLFSIFLLAWQETGAIHYFDHDRDEFFSNMLEKIINIFAIMCMGIIVVLPLVFHWFINTSYNEAYYNIPIYLVAFLINVVIGLLGVVYVATNKTYEIAKTTILAAIINVVVHLALINSIGLYAASISTFAGYFITLIYRVINTKKYLKIRYNMKQYMIIAIEIVICCVVYYVNSKIVSIILLPFFLVVTVYFNRTLIKDALDLIKIKLGSH